MIHTLKTDVYPFDAVWDGRKRFEFRKDDRHFEVGDILDLRNEQTRRYILARVTYVTTGLYGVPDGFAVLSIEVIAKGELRKAPALGGTPA